MNERLLGTLEGKGRTTDLVSANITPICQAWDEADKRARAIIAADPHA